MKPTKLTSLILYLLFSCVGLLSVSDKIINQSGLITDIREQSNKMASLFLGHPVVVYC